jgi:glutamate carboxypeptidase
MSAEPAPAASTPTSTSTSTSLTAALQPQLDRYIDELGALCAIESPSGHLPGLVHMAEWLRAWATDRGWAVRSVPDAAAGDSLVVTIPGGAADGPRLLLAAHMDTVYPVGIAAARPLRREGGTLLAPGVADNKSGLLSGLYAVAALEDAGLLDPIGAISLVCGSDEESHMRASGALLRELAPTHDVGFVLEAGRTNGNIVVARKGIGAWTLEVAGRAAHAGVEPWKGANAIAALAQQIVALQALNGMRPGVSLNVGLISGGTVINVVPEAARADFEARVVHPEDMEPLAEAVARIAAATYVPGTSATLSGGWRIAPMARTPAIAALATLADACAHELGFAVAATATGGASYANILTEAGLPVLDGLGPIGGQVHSPGEYLLVESIVPRTALLALLLVRYAERGVSS